MTFLNVEKSINARPMPDYAPPFLAVAGEQNVTHLGTFCAIMKLISPWHPCIHKDSWMIESTDVQRAANKKPSLYEVEAVFILALS